MTYYQFTIAELKSVLRTVEKQPAITSVQFFVQDQFDKPDYLVGEIVPNKDGQSLHVWRRPRSIPTTNNTFEIFPILDLKSIG